jgi:hypothetical protein
MKLIFSGNPADAQFRERSYKEESGRLRMCQGVEREGRNFSISQCGEGQRKEVYYTAGTVWEEAGSALKPIFSHPRVQTGSFRLK